MTNEELNDRLDFYTRRLVMVKEFKVLDSGTLRIEGDFSVEQLTDLIGVMLNGETLQ